MREANGDIKRRRPFYSDLSFWSLLGANIFSIVWALKAGLSLELMIWVYFTQNIILGIFWPAKVIGSLGDSFYSKKVQAATTFLPSYLIMHFIYGFTLYQLFGPVLSGNIKYILWMGGVFVLSETVSYIFEFGSISRAKPLSLSKVILFPYARVGPMHLMLFSGIILSAESTGPYPATLTFLLLKAIADMGMYIVEQSRIFSRLASYEKHKKRLLFDCLKGQKEVCRLCQKVIGRNESPKYIKENAVCTKCYNRIEKEKKNGL